MLNVSTHEGRIRENMARIESNYQLGPLSKRTRHSLHKTRSRLDRCGDDIKRQPVEPHGYVAFLWDLVAAFAIDVSSLSNLSSCSRWHRLNLQRCLGQALVVNKYLQEKTQESTRQNLLCGSAFVQWFGELDTSSHTLRSIISIVPLPSLPPWLDPFMARIVGGWSNFFALPRRPITKAMRDRTRRGKLSEPNSIQPTEVDAGVTFLEDDRDSWALVFRFKIEGCEPRCFWLHKFESSVDWETSAEYDQVTVDDRELWFPFSQPRPEGLLPALDSRRLRSLNNKSYIWLENLARHGSATTFIKGKLLQVVLCPRSPSLEKALLQ